MMIGVLAAIVLATSHTRFHCDGKLISLRMHLSANHPAVFTMVGLALHDHYQSRCYCAVVARNTP